MLQPRTLKILAALLGGYALLCLPAFIGPAFLQEPSSRLLLVPFLTPHLFHYLGVPGLLERGGHCGWGWCAPSLLGWVLSAVFWLALAWLAAWGIASAFRSRGESAPRGRRCR